MFSPFAPEIHSCSRREQELPVRKLLHRTQDGSCLAELPGFNIAQLRLSYRELEQLAEKKGWTLQKL